MANPDPYYQRTEVSNSDLTQLKELLHPPLITGDREAAFRFGTLVDALVTEPDRVNLYARTVDDVEYDGEEFSRGLELWRALKAESGRDGFLDLVLRTAQTQKVSVHRGQRFAYCGFPFELDTRCKWDWWLGGFGGDLKTTSAATQTEFENAMDVFDWDRSRAWYMDLVGSDRDFIYAVSKKNCKVFKKFIRRGDETYLRGREKYEELAFRWWALSPMEGA